MVLHCGLLHGPDLVNQCSMADAALSIVLVSIAYCYLNAICAMINAYLGRHLTGKKDKDVCMNYCMSHFISQSSSATASAFVACAGCDFVIF